MQNLKTTSKAATILLRQYLGKGYCAGAEFPGATIRQGIDKLYKVGFLKTDATTKKMMITDDGQAYLNANHLRIPS